MGLWPSVDSVKKNQSIRPKTNIYTHHMKITCVCVCVWESNDENDLNYSKIILIAVKLLNKTICFYDNAKHQHRPQILQSIDLKNLFSLHFVHCFKWISQNLFEWINIDSKMESVRFFSLFGIQFKNNNFLLILIGKFIIYHYREHIHSLLISTIKSLDISKCSSTLFVTLPRLVQCVLYFFFFHEMF